MAMVFGAALAGTAGWWSTHHAIGAALAAVAGVIATGSAVALWQFNRAQADAPAFSLTGLSPQQAHVMLGASGANVDSAVLRALEDVVACAEQDANDALARCLALRQEHPQSVAVLAELARRYVAVGQPDEARVWLANALRTALRLGMNGLCARLFAEFDALHEGLNLDDATLTRLARVLGAQGDEAGRTACEQQLARQARVAAGVAAHSRS